MAAGRVIEVVSALRGTTTAIPGVRRFQITRTAAPVKTGHSDNETKKYQGRVEVAGTLEIDNDQSALDLLALSTAENLVITYRGSASNRKMTIKNARYFDAPSNIPGIQDTGETGVHRVAMEAEVGSTDTIATMITLADAT